MPLELVISLSEELQSVLDHYFFGTSVKDSVLIDIDDRLKALTQKLDKLTQTGEQNMADLSALKAAVEQNTNAEQSAITLIQQIAQKLQAAAGDQQAVNDLATTLQQQAQALADAVVANTPAA